ncbi:MAG TPA: hypothetical protein VI911_11900 [Patescibacteria group bacterium]|nr:hypothetical protein [Patescibacteria group bacterium]
MADYTISKEITNNVYPVISSATSDLLGRCEPLITPDKLKLLYLKGIDLSDYSSDDLKILIEYAVNTFESESKLFVNKVQMKERIPYDRALYAKFLYMKTQHGPIISVEDLSVVSSNGENIFRLPASWVDMGQSHRRQLNLLPILALLGANSLVDGSQNNAGLVFLQAINGFSWLPAFWTVTYTVGLSHIEGQVPKIVNEIIGMIAAIDILSAKQAQIKYNSTSISQDSLAQSSSGPGNQTYQPRIQMLEEKKAKMMGQVKAKFFQKYYLSNV